MRDWVKYAAKAVTAVGVGLAQVAVVAAPQSEAGTTITVQEWVTVALAALAALGVYLVPNRAAGADTSEQ